MGDPLPVKSNVFGRFISARYMLAILGSLGMAIIYGLKVNLSVTIVSMVNHTSIGLSDGKKPALEECADLKVGNYSASNEDGPFTWPGTMQGTMLSSYFWGYILAQIPGARLAEVFSAKWVMFFAVAVNIFCTILTPLTAKLHFLAMLVMRVIEGIGGGVTFPAMHVLLAHWSPPGERSVMSSIVYAGTALGTVVSMSASGIIAGALGWEYVFYIMGGASGVWLMLWVFLVADSPESHAYIDEDERQFLMSSLGAEVKAANKKQLPVPWKRIITSPAFLAILVSHTCNNWGWYMILIELPLYMKTVLKFRIAQNAILTAIPFFCMWIFSMLLSKALDSMRAKKLIDTTCARKSATFIASVVPMVCFLILSYIGCMRTFAVFLTTIAITAVGGMFCGFLSNHIDIAPNFAGTLMGITNTAATIPGIIVPIFVGKLTQSDQSVAAWRVIFWTTIVFYLIEIVVYVMFASGEEQDWNRSTFNEAIEAQPLKSPNSESVDPNPIGYKSTEKSDGDAQASQTN